MRLIKKNIQESVKKERVGVYALYFREWPHRAYFGSSKCMRRRLLSHANSFLKGKHKNWKLSRLHDTYKDSLSFAIVADFATEKQARDYEQLLIDFDPRASYNVDTKVYKYKRK